MPWARLIRGSRSKLNTVAFLAASARSASSDWATPKKLSVDTPGGSAATASTLGGLTRDDQARAGHAARAVGCRGRTGLGVGRVVEGRLVSCTRLDPDHPARADQLLDHVRDEGHAALSGTGLRGDRQ